MIRRIIGYILVSISLFINIYQIISSNLKIVNEENKIEYTIKKELGYNVKDTDTYDMIIEIPKINLKKGIYKKDDERNDISKNITIHSDSDYPDKENSNLILMAHSGNSDIAYFNELYKLDSDSLVKIYYNKVKYTYKIDSYYEVDKTGTLEIKRDTSKKTITLITCSQTDKTKQLVYIGYLIDEI